MTLVDAVEGKEYTVQKISTDDEELLRGGTDYSSIPSEGRLRSFN